MNKGRTPDENQLAKRLVDELMPEESTLEEALSKDIRHLIAVALGRQGGLKGGKARAKKLTAEKRKEIAKKAAEARWGTRPSK
ncbi:MAG: hypothetical protein WCF57_04340 [Pyrinomonadaceae bacterium]